MDFASRLPAQLEVTTGASLGAAAETLRAHVEARSSIEDEPARLEGRHLAGSVTGARVTLAVRPPRKGFEVVFRGTLEAGAAGAELRGTIDVSDHRQIRMFLGIVAAVGAMIALAALALGVSDAANGTPFDWRVPALALGIGASTVIGTILVAADIERTAAGDARLLAAFLRRAFKQPAASPSSGPRDIAGR